MFFLLSLIIGVLVGSCVFFLSKEEPSFLKERFKKTAKSNSFKKNVSTDLDTISKQIFEKIKVSPKQLHNTKNLLLQSGFASSDEDVMKVEIKRIKYFFITGIFMAFLSILLPSKNILILSLVISIYMYEKPILKLKKIRNERRKEFMRYLPDAVDLLGICVQAGLGLDASFLKVSDEFELTSKTISSEFERLNKDILSGINREDAYKNLLLRNQNPDLQSFIALLVQSEKLGTSITQSLDAFCDSLRTKKRQRIEELSQKASTKMTIPMVLFMLPAIFIIILYPAIQKIMVNMGHM